MQRSFCVLGMGLLISCGDDGEEIGTDPSVRALDSITVDLNTTYQTIRGFGACNTVFNGVRSFPKESDMQKAYGMGDDELGLSIFRISVPATSNTWADVAEVAKMAQDRGAIVFASPWDAPEEMRDPDHEERVLLPSKYQDYVDHLNSYNDFMTNNGVNLYAISIQNEPDIGEWTQWTVQQVMDFTINFADGINNRVITAESFNFNRAYYNSIL